MKHSLKMMAILLVSNYSIASYTVHIPLEITQSGSLPDGSIKFVDPSSPTNPWTPLKCLFQFSFLAIPLPFPLSLANLQSLNTQKYETFVSWTELWCRITSFLYSNPLSQVEHLWGRVWECWCLLDEGSVSDEEGEEMRDGEVVLSYLYSWVLVNDLWQLRCWQFMRCDGGFGVKGNEGQGV